MYAVQLRARTSDVPQGCAPSKVYPQRLNLKLSGSVARIATLQRPGGQLLFNVMRTRRSNEILAPPGRSA